MHPYAYASRPEKQKESFFLFPSLCYFISAHGSPGPPMKSGPDCEHLKGFSPQTNSYFIRERFWTLGAFKKVLSK